MFDLFCTDTILLLTTVAIQKTYSMLNYSTAVCQQTDHKYNTFLSNAEDVLSTNTIWQYGDTLCDPVKAACLCFVHILLFLSHTLESLSPLRLLSNPG